MPIITVKTNKFNDASKSFEKVAERLTESTTRVLKKERRLVVVNFTNSLADSGWFVGGRDVGEDSNLHVEVSIKITLGTNTKQEKSTWVREVYEAISQEMGELGSPIYISVEEFSGESWGYDGLTATARKMLSA